MATEPVVPVSQRVFMVLGSILLVVAVLYFASTVLIPLALALLLTFILGPPAVSLQRSGLPRPLAVTVVVFLAVAILGCVLWVLTLQLNDLANRLPEHSQTIAEKIKALRGNGQGLLGKVYRFIEDVSKDVQQATTGPLPEDEEKPLPVVVRNDKPVAWNLFPSVLGRAAELLASVILVVMLTAFMLLRREDLRDRLIQLVGHGRLTVTTRAMDEAAERISRYLLMQLTVNVLLGAFFCIALLFIGVPYAFLWGALTAALRFIPYIGTWISLLFPLVVSIAVTPGWTQPLETVVAFTALELLTANVVEPLLFSHSTGTSTVALLVAAAFWTWVWGPIGLVLSTPLTVCLLVLGRHVQPLSFIHVLLGTEPVLDTEVRFYQRLLARDEDEATEIVEKYLESNPPEQLYDDVLVPALAAMKRDGRRHDLPPGAEEFMLRVTRDLAEDLVSHEPPDEDGENRPRALVIGCPAQDEVDEAALQMFRQLLPPAACEVEVVSTEMLTAEMIAHVEQQAPAVVCIAALPPSGLARARYLCKRLRARVPGLKIVVGCWGQRDKFDRDEQRLRDAGANLVGTTLLQTRAQILPLLALAPRPVTAEPIGMPAVTRAARAT